MNKGAIVAVSGAAIGLAALGYVFYKRSQASSAVASATPSGTDASGAPTYINQAGQVVNSAGTIVNAATSILNSLSGKKLTIKPTQLPADFNGPQYLINNPDVAAARDKAHPNGWDPAKHYLEYGYKEGRTWLPGQKVYGVNGLLGFNDNFSHQFKLM